MNRLQYVESYFTKFIEEVAFREKIGLMSLSFNEAQLIECYNYIKTLKK